MMSSIVIRARRGREEIVVVFRDRDIGGAAMNSVEDLHVFKLAHELALKIYSVTKSFPKEETYSLVDQMRRAWWGGGRFDRRRTPDLQTASPVRDLDSPQQDSPE